MKFEGVQVYLSGGLEYRGPWLLGINEKTSKPKIQ